MFWYGDRASITSCKRPDKCPAFSFEQYTTYFLIGSPIFSAGAGGNAGFAPAFCASLSGRAGSGAGVVGRVPPGFGSAGPSSLPAGTDGVVSGGCCVVCARWISPRDASCINDIPDSARPPAIRIADRRKFVRSAVRFSSGIIAAPVDCPMNQRMVTTIVPGIARVRDVALNDL